MFAIRNVKKIRMALRLIVGLIFMSFLLFEIDRHLEKPTLLINENYEGVILNLNSVWIPSPKTIAEFENGLSSYLPTLSNESRGKLEFIVANLKNYKRQYVGTISDGKIVLECKFFTLGIISSLPEGYWKSKQVHFLDGGVDVFELSYNVFTKEYFDLLLN